MPAALRSMLKTAPKLSDAKAAKARLQDVLQDEEAGAQCAALLREKPVHALLAGLADHSPYLWQLVRMDVPRLARLLDATPDAAFESCLAQARARCDAATDDAEVMHVLRRTKQEVALLIALADIGGVWDVVQVITALTRFADACVSNALRFLLRGAAVCTSAIIFWT